MSAKFESEYPAPEDFEMIADPATATATPVVTAAVVQEGMNREEEDASQAQNIMVGAGILSCLLGTIMCCPTAGCLAGVGAAYGTTRPTPAGEAARSMGRLAVTCGSKAAELNEKHHIMDKTKRSATTCWKTSKNFVQEQQVVERTSMCLKSMWAGLQKVNEDYRIAERSWQGISTALNTANDKVLNHSFAPAEIAAEAPDGQVFPPRGAARHGDYMAVARSANNFEGK